MLVEYGASFAELPIQGNPKRAYVTLRQKKRANEAVLPFLTEIQAFYSSHPLEQLEQDVQIFIFVGMKSSMALAASPGLR
jgi:hypothetical protein